MYKFDDLSDVQGALQKLMSREPPLARVLPRSPGTKESRYVELLSGGAAGSARDETTDVANASLSVEGGRVGGDDALVARLESEVAALREEVAELKLEFARFRKQFE
jgi:hypothetical protein